MDGAPRGPTWWEEPQENRRIRLDTEDLRIGQRLDRPAPGDSCLLLGHRPTITGLLVANGSPSSTDAIMHEAVY